MRQSFYMTAGIQERRHSEGMWQSKALPVHYCTYQRKDANRAAEALQCFLNASIPTQHSSVKYPAAIT